MKSARLGTAVLTLVAFVACSTTEQPTPFEPGGPALARASGSSIQVAMTGQLAAASQLVSGRNDASSIVAKGNYALTMSGLDPSTLQCPQQAGSIPWEGGLVLFVQQNTPATGVLDLSFTKPSGDANRVDSWETKIGTYAYKFQFFRWGSSSSALNADGSTTVSFQDGSVEVFKKKGGRIVSREQCFGPYLDYELTAK